MSHKLECSDEVVREWGSKMRGKFLFSAIRVGNAAVSVPVRKPLFKRV